MCSNTPVEHMTIGESVSLPQDPLVPEVVGSNSQRCTTDEGELGLCRTLVVEDCGDEFGGN